MYTRDVETINIKGMDAIEELIESVRGEKVEMCREALQEKAELCKKAFERRWDQMKEESADKLKIENKSFYFCQTNKYYYLIPNWGTMEEDFRKKIKNYNKLCKFASNGNIEAFQNGLEDIDGVSMKWMQEVDKRSLSARLRSIFGENKYITYLHENEVRHFYFYSSWDGKKENWDYGCSGFLVPIHKTKSSDMSVVTFLVKNRLLPAGLSEEEKKCFRLLFSLADEWIIEFDSEIRLADNFEDIIGEGTFLGVEMSRKQLFKEMASRPISDEALKTIVTSYLNCDKVRADIEPYDEGQIFEVNRGHWELWPDSGSRGVKQAAVMLKTPLVARNPLADVNRSGVVGIDFGTKSTVVVLLDDNSRIHQMRIGSGQLRKEARKSDYENPTVMEFRDIRNFMARYREMEGRPHTRWKDVTISHSAADSLRNAQDSQDYYTFFSDLKQWSADSSRKIRIKDLTGYEEVLNDFLEVEDKSLNPIEVYAYYLGLAINNMRNGIYLDYILSYPVNYPVKVRAKIVESFKRGIRKSLPDEVLRDKECMELFRVKAGASEPAAYAISALKGYGFTPREGEKIYYGIFDFGGGTTDFDFGIWRCATEKESRRADYVIEHFGAGGDRYLGGENLLELLAFDVFKANQGILREKDIPFFKPSERSAFPGSEMLLSSSQEARLNTRQLMEKLRPFWESGATAGRKEPSDGGLAAIHEGMIKVSLFQKDGGIAPNVELNVDAAELERILTERIRVGVVNYFEAAKNLFTHPRMGDSLKMHIFLAGNSSRSPIVGKLFEELIAEWEKDIGQAWREQGRDLKAEGLFEVYPALGTPEADAKRAERGLAGETGLAEYEKPTGKTGVAYGLLEGRNASRIKIISEIMSSDESKFRYYIGSELRGRFHVEMERDMEYGKWAEFIDASETDFEIFYTSLPEATTNQMDIRRVKRVPCRIKKPCRDEAVNIYVRAVEPDVLEYAVGKYKDVTEEIYAEGPYRIKLEE